MALKEHPFLVTTSYKHDQSTITYDITKSNRSDAVGKVFKLNADGRAELPGDGEEFDGVITSVDKTHITAAYMFGGLRVPIADGETVVRGNKLVAGVGANSEKGYVKAVDIPADLAALVAADIDTDEEKLAAYNAARTQLNAIGDVLKGKGSVIEFDATHALMAFPG